ANPDFKTLVKAAQAAGLIDTLNSAGPFTLFAPTDDAFAKVDKHALADLLKPENRERLRNVLLYHVVSAKVEAAEALKLTSAQAVNGQRLDLRINNGKLMIDDAKVTATDVGASNGVIHVIDKVLMPAQDDIAGVAAHAGMFKTLLAAARAAGLTDALTGKDPLTLFAPTDEAFDKLPKGTVESLLKPENKEMLKKVLLLHVVPGRVYSDKVVKLASAKSLDGQTLTPAVKDGRVSVNGAAVVKTDIEATNGVVHVIDAVLLPAK
ncbi:MAG: fasciclin domain-containing protein, partial [Phycisphaerales bacterium]|nr:fasciclin domain-containing protein [Phycisphaerales bacterium]